MILNYRSVGRIVSIMFIFVIASYLFSSAFQVVDAWMVSSRHSSFATYRSREPYHRTKNNQGLQSSFMNMYFDDISRSGDNSLHFSAPPNSSIRTISASANQKEAAIVSADIYETPTNDAPKIAEETVREEVEKWAKTSDGILVPSNQPLVTTAASTKQFLYEDVLGPAIVCDSATVLGCLKQFWNSIKTVIEREFDENMIQRKQKDSWFFDPDIELVQWLVFPNSFTTEEELLEFSGIIDIALKEHTAHIGNQFSLRIFHPKQEASPLLLKPSPHPILALQFKPSSMETIKEEMRAQRQELASQSTGNSLFYKQGDKENSINNDDEDEDFNTSSFIDDPILDLPSKQRDLEVLFNSEAVEHFMSVGNDLGIQKQRDGTSVLRKYYEVYYQERMKRGRKPMNVKNDHGGGSDPDDEFLDSSLSLVRNFQMEHRLRTRKFTKKQVQAISLSWIEEQITANNEIFFDDVNSSSSLSTASKPATTAINYSDARPWFGSLFQRKSTSTENDLDDASQPEASCDSESNTVKPIPMTTNDLNWIISHHKDAEYVYADLWTAFEEVVTKSTSLINTGDGKNLQPSRIESVDDSQQPVGTPFSRKLQKKLIHSKQYKEKAEIANYKNPNDDAYRKVYSWMNKIVKPVVVAENEKKNVNKDYVDVDSLATKSADVGDASEKHIEGSIMFVATNLYAFKAEAFKRFAISVHLALQRSIKLMNAQEKQQPKINYYLEVFHPEYVGASKGYNHTLRRAPFPMIQISYQVIAE